MSGFLRIIDRAAFNMNLRTGLAIEQDGAVWEAETGLAPEQDGAVWEGETGFAPEQDGAVWEGKSRLSREDSAGNMWRLVLMRCTNFSRMACSN